MQLGITQIHVDRVRSLGRAAGTAGGTDPNELCGRCTFGRAAVLPNGDVSGCVMSRWMIGGNVKTTPLAAIIAGPRWAEIRAVVPGQRRECSPEGEACGPDEDSCGPGAGSCNPNITDGVASLQPGRFQVQ